MHAHAALRLGLRFRDSAHRFRAGGADSSLMPLRDGLARCYSPRTTREIDPCQPSAPAATAP